MVLRGIRRRGRLVRPHGRTTGVARLLTRLDVLERAFERWFPPELGVAKTMARTPLMYAQRTFEHDGLSSPRDVPGTADARRDRAPQKPE